MEDASLHADTALVSAPELQPEPQPEPVPVPVPVPVNVHDLVASHRNSVNCKDTSVEQCQMEASCAGQCSRVSIIPRFNLQLAKRLFFRGRTIEELTAAAERLGDEKLKADILEFSLEFEEDMDDGW